MEDQQAKLKEAEDELSLKVAELEDVNSKIEILEATLQGLRLMHVGTESEEESAEHGKIKDARQVSMLYSTLMLRQLAHFIRRLLFRPHPLRSFFPT